MTPCPVCQKPVDTLRARHVGVVTGKVVAYCSPECKAKAAGVATVTPITPQPPVVAAAPPKQTPARGAPVKASLAEYDSGPVIEILHEPVSGVVTSARDERVASAPVVVPVTDAGSKPTAAPEKSGPVIASSPAPAPSPSPNQAAKTTTEIDPREILGVDDDDAGEAADDDRPPGKNTIRRRRDSIDAKMADDWLDDEPADVRPDSEVEGERRGGRGWVVLLVLALLAAGGFAVYKFVYLPRVSGSASAMPEPHLGPAQPPPQPVVQADAAEAAPDAAVETPPNLKGDARAKAEEVLGTLLVTKDSLRVQRQAAIALSRTGDAVAIARLEAAIAPDSKDKLEEAGRIEIAYALARAGNRKGLDLLVADLGSARRDDKLGAARMLAQLGDQRALATLANYLEYSQLRLGVAQQMALYKDAKAIAALEQIRKDDKANADDKATATIALVVAGKTELAGEVRAMLTDTRFNVFAAEALAGLRDEAARPVLEKQLELPSLRVGAARNLHRLDPDRDMTAYLDTLGRALAKSSRDTDQLSNAEAILMLVGPPTWWEHR